MPADKRLANRDFLRTSDETTDRLITDPWNVKSTKNQYLELAFLTRLLTKRINVVVLALLKFKMQCGLIGKSYLSNVFKLKNIKSELLDGSANSPKLILSKQENALENDIKST